MPPPDRSSARSIEHGEVLGILGPNGPGRSTTVGIGQRSRRVAGNLEVEAYRRRLLPSPRDRSTKEVEVEVKELGHIVLYVRDIERSSGFYRDVLGWRQVLPEPGQPSQLPMAMFSAPSGRTHHELLLIEVGPDAAPQPEGKRVGMYHFGLKVGDSDDELREALARLQESGTTLLGASDHTVTHSLYIADPDGNEIELYVDVPGVDWRSDPTLIAAPIKPLRL
jgi:catechol-2,3-dioxygenase